MRQYRAIPIGGKDFVYGWYSEEAGKSYITYVRGVGISFKPEVIPETVGQQVGLKDKNGKEIYEGDMIRWKWNKPCEKCEHQSMMEDIVRFGALGATVLGYRLIDPQHGDWLESAEVIGNIHQHPELMENNK